MSRIVCAAVKPENKDVIQRCIESLLASKVKQFFYGTKPEDFKEAKTSGSPLTLIVDGPMHDVIKDLSDDVTAAERRVNFIYSTSAGMDSYRLPEIADQLKGIKLHNANGCYSDVLGEHVIFSMLYFNRSPWRLCASKAAKLYDRFNMIELRGQKVGIFGYGSIGQAAGVRAKALGMDVTGIRRTVPASGVDEHGIRVCTDESADKVLAESDFIVGVLPGTAATQHFFRREVFAKMKPSAVFINIGRGVTQCEADLVEALNAGTIRGAALDVFEVEPLPAESPLWDLPDDKLLLSAHCADWTEDLMKISAERFCKIFDEYDNNGKSDAHVVDPIKGY